MLQFFKLKSK